MLKATGISIRFIFQIDKSTMSNSKHHFQIFQAEFKKDFQQTKIKVSLIEFPHYMFDATISVFLEAFSVDNSRAGLIILLLGNPHLLEGRERCQNGAANPH